VPEIYIYKKKKTEKTCVVGRGKREKNNFFKKGKSKKYYFNDIRNGLGNLLWYVYLYRKAKNSLDP
jgi:hypothetical protein